MKILLANKFFFPKGGAETVFFQERDFFLEQGSKVIDFSMVHPDNLPSPYDSYFIPNVEYRKTSTKQGLKKIYEQLQVAREFIYNGNAVSSINRLIEKEKPEIAHLHNIYHQITPVIIPVLKKAGVKVVLTLHDYKVVCPNYQMLQNGELCSKCQGKKFWHAVTGKCENNSMIRSLLLAVESYWHLWAKSYEQVDLFLAPSKFMADMMIRYRLDPAKIKVLHNGIDIETIQPPADDKEFAIYLGRISKEKGIETLLEAYKKSNITFPLKIVGTGPLLDNLKKHYPMVEFTGFETGKALQNIIHNTSFVIVPSEWYENCSMVVLEAMAHSKPVIGARVGGIPEQIDDNITGLLFESGNSNELAQKMKLLATEKKKRLRMGKMARQKLERDYSLKNHCTQLTRIFNNLVHQH